jgi:hypothetical protein
MSCELLISQKLALSVICKCTLLPFIKSIGVDTLNQTVCIFTLYWLASRGGAVQQASSQAFAKKNNYYHSNYDTATRRAAVRCIHPWDRLHIATLLAVCRHVGHMHCDKQCGGGYRIDILATTALLVSGIRLVLLDAWWHACYGSGRRGSRPLCYLYLVYVNCGQ